MHTEMDCMVKRQKKGYLFLTGDEVPYPTLRKQTVETIIGDRLDEDLTCEEIVAKVQETFVPFFIIPDRARARKCEQKWRDLLGDHVLCLDSPIDVCYVAAGAILLNEGRASNMKELATLLSNAGMSSINRASVIRSLTPFADVVLNSASKKKSGWKFF